jgi:hypothetical protein
MIGLVLTAAAVGAVAGQLEVNPSHAGQLEVNPSLTTETRAGEAPIIYGGAPEASLVEVLTPSAELYYHGQRLELLTNYELRMFWRSTRDDPHPSPLYLNTVNLTLTAHPSRTLILKLNGVATEGQADYTYLPTIYGPNQAALGVAPRIFSANGTGGADLHVTPLVIAGIALQAVYTRPIDEAQSTVPGTTFTTPSTTPLTAPTTLRTAYVLPHFTSFSGTPGAAFHLSRTDDLAASMGVEYQHISGLNALTADGTVQPVGALSALIVMPTLGVHRYLAPRSELTLKVGLAVTHLVGDFTGSPYAISPIGAAILDARLMNLRQVVLHARVSPALEYYLDPVLGTTATHAVVNASLYLGLPKNWTIGLQGSFVTSLRAHLPPTLTPTTTTTAATTTTTPINYPDEVAASVELPIRHLLSDDILFEFGGRWADRSPFFTAPDFGFHQRQLWLYVLFTGTTRPTWALPRAVAPPP